MSYHENYFKPYRERIQQMHKYSDEYDDYQQIPYNRNRTSPRKQENKYTYKDYYKELTQSPNKNKNNEKQYSHSNSYNYYKNKSGTKSGRQMHEPIWNYLYNKGLQSQKQINTQHENQKNKLDIQCTFQPMIKKNTRYMIPSSSNFLQRNTIWYDNKIQKIVKEKEYQVNKDLQDCTFKPRINNYKHKNLSKQKSKSVTPSKSRRQLNKSLYEPKQTETKRHESDINKQQVGKIKNLIRKELKRIQL